MAIATQRDAKHPSSDAHGVGMRAENRGVVNGIAGCAGPHPGSNFEGF